MADDVFTGVLDFLCLFFCVLCQNGAHLWYYSLLPLIEFVFVCVVELSYEVAMVVDCLLVILGKSCA
jgi:hypothetical protein